MCHYHTDVKFINLVFQIACIVVLPSVYQCLSDVHVLSTIYLCLSIYLLYLICLSFCLLYFIYQSAVFHLHIILSFVFHLSIIVVFSSVYHCVCCIFHLSLCLLYFIYHCNSCIFHLSIIVTVVYLSVYHCVCFIFIFLSLQPSCTYICLILHDLKF